MATLDENGLAAADCWRYEIQHGPDGETNYAWLYRGNEMIATMKTHHAAALTAALSCAEEKAVEVKTDLLADVLDDIRVYRDQLPEEDGSWESWYFAAFDLAMSRVRETFTRHGCLRSALVDVPAVESEPVVKPDCWQDEAAAEREFTEYFVRNYPGPDTIIHDPNWHAPKLFRAAKRALLATTLSTRKGSAGDGAATGTKDNTHG